MKKGKIKFEIIVPCFNSAWSLRRTIESFLNQTYTNWRLWFVNDGSTDNSYEIAKEFSDKDSRILLFSGSNQGVSAAMNFARGKILEESEEFSIVTCCGADDWFTPDHLEVYEKEFRKDPSIDFLYSDVELFFQNGEKAFSYGVAYHDVFDPSKLSFENPIYAPTAAWKVKCFSVGEFDGRLNSIEDWDFYARLAFAKYKMVHLKKVLSYVTVGKPSGMAGKRTNEQWELFQKKRREEQIFKGVQ